MKNAEYWRGRALILEEAAHKRAEELTAGLDEIYDEAMRETLKEIESWYLRLAKNNNLTLADAKKLLTKNELDEFHWDVEKYIKVGEDHGLEPDWMKKLENASAKFHISRLEAVEVKIQQQIERLHAGQVGKLDKHLRQVAGETYLRTAYEVQKGVGIAFDITALDEKKLDTFISNPWSTDDRTFRDRCWTMKENLVESVRKSLIKGLIRGDAPGKLTKEIQKEFSVSKYKAGRLVNTETAYFAMQSTKQCYKDINVDMVEIVGTLDSHTCDLCGSFDGKVIRMTDFAPGETVPPWHPNCRCTTAPAIPDEYKGTRLARDEDGKQYEVPGNMSFDEWKSKFSSNGVDKPQKSDIIEEERMNSSSDYAVPKGLVDSRSFREKFNRMDEDEGVCREYYQAAKDMLRHRSGTDGEDLYFRNSRLGKWYKSTSGKEKGSPEYTDEIVRAIRNAQSGELVSFHNHPQSMPPSVNDLNAALKNGYKKGYIICHDGKVFEYTAPKKEIDTVIYNSSIKYYRKSGKSEYEAQFQTIRELSKIYEFMFKEV